MLLKRIARESAFLRASLRPYGRAVRMGLGAVALVDVLEILPPLILKGAIDDAVAGGEGVQRALLLWALAYLGVGILQGACRYAWRMYLVRASLYAGGDVRRRFSDHLFGLGASFFDRKPIGEMMSLATSDVDAVRMAMGPGVLVFFDALFYLATVPVAMFLLSPELTLYSFLPLLVLPFWMARNERLAHERFEATQASAAGISAQVQEGLGGARVLKTLGQEGIFVDRLRSLGERHRRLGLRLAVVNSSFGPVMDLFVSVGLIILLAFGGRALMAGDAAEGALTLGMFVAFQRYIGKLVWPMAALGMAITLYQRGVASSGRLMRILSERSDVRDGADEESAASARPAPAPRAPERGLEFRDLTFAYPGGSRPVLEGIRLEVGRGERVGVLGPVGGGKSALLGLLPRLYPAPGGGVFWQGVDLNDWPLAELRARIGFVSQDLFLFGESVAENIAWGLPSASASSVVPFARAAQIEADIERFPRGFDTLLGERGLTLSGGQRQRLTLARALARSPELLVLDDALSSVDVQTEERILTNLRESRRADATTLVAAHRISTLRDCDRVVVLDRRVLQVGTHAELLSDRGGLYAKVYEEQRRLEELEHELRRAEEART